MALFGGDSTAFNTPQSATFGASGIGDPQQLAFTLGNKNKLQNVTFAVTDNGAIQKANELTKQILDMASEYGQSPASNFFNKMLTFALLGGALILLSKGKFL